MTTTIRLALPTDAEAIAALSVDLGYPIAPDEMARRLTILLAHPEHAVFVAHQADQVIGWLHVCTVASLESGLFAEVRGLVVAIAHRRQGAGCALMAQAEQWAIAQNCPKVRLRSNVMRTDSRQFYEAVGYEVKKAQNVFEKSLSSAG